MNHKAQVEALILAVNDFSSANGEKLVRRSEEAAKLLLLWLELLKKYCLTGVADVLLEASAAAVREAAALLAIGAVRPCLFSLRAQIDLVLGWVFFKDHRVEYDLVNRTGDGFKLKRDILRYFTDSFPSYGEKIGLLGQIKTRKEVDPYRLLSAHIHAQSPYVVPAVNDLRDVIYVSGLAEDCIDIQLDVAEFLSDHLFAIGLVNYVSLTSDIVNSIKARTSNASQKSILFK